VIQESDLEVQGAGDLDLHLLKALKSEARADVVHTLNLRGKIENHQSVLSTITHVLQFLNTDHISLVISGKLVKPVTEVFSTELFSPDNHSLLSRWFYRRESRSSESPPKSKRDARSSRHSETPPKSKRDSRSSRRSETPPKSKRDARSSRHSETPPKSKRDSRSSRLSETPPKSKRDARSSRSRSDSPAKVSSRLAMD